MELQSHPGNTVDLSPADENNESRLERLSVLEAQHNQRDPEHELNEKLKQ